MRVHSPVQLPHDLPGSNRAWVLVPLLALAASMAALTMATDGDATPEPSFSAAPGPVSLPAPADTIAPLLRTPSADPAGDASVSRMLEIEHVQAF